MSECCENLATALKIKRGSYPSKSVRLNVTLRLINRQF